MRALPDNGTVFHISDKEIKEEGLRGIPRLSDRVIIPARNEGEGIVRTLEYLMGLGFAPSQILVLVNGPSEIDGRPDETADRALALNPKLRVLHQSDLIGTANLVERLSERYGIKPSRLHGKGTAMFAATLALHQDQTPDDARVIFLDADIENIQDVDPVGRLLIGAARFPERVSMIKLASLGRDNAGIHAFLSTLMGDCALIGALRWPLCGQVIVRWRDLKRMRLAGGYAVEMAMMMDVGAREHNPTAFGEVEIGTPLRDRRNPDRKDVQMFHDIMVFAGRVHQANLHGLPFLTRRELVALNQMPATALWVPVEKQGDGPNQLETRYPDAVFPSIAELFS